jgi:hypothetical protein
MAQTHERLNMTATRDVTWHSNEAWSLDHNCRSEDVRGLLELGSGMLTMDLAKRIDEPG